MFGPCPVGGTKSRISRRIRAPRGVRSSGRRVVGRPAPDPVRGRESGVLPCWHELSDEETEFRVPGPPQRARRTDRRKESEQEIPFPREILGEVRVPLGATGELLSASAGENAGPFPTLLPRAAPSEHLATVDPPVVLHGNHGSLLESLHAGATPLRTLGFSASHRRLRVSNGPPPADCPLLHHRLPSLTSRRKALPSRKTVGLRARSSGHASPRNARSRASALRDPGRAARRRGQREPRQARQT